MVQLGSGGNIPVIQISLVAFVALMSDDGLWPGVADDHRQLDALEIQRVFHGGALEGFNFGLVPCLDGPESAKPTVAVRQLGPPLATIRS